MLYALVVTFFVATSPGPTNPPSANPPNPPTWSYGRVPQSIEIGRYDPAFCNAQATIANKLFKGVVYRCVPAGPFVDSGKIPN